MGLFGRKGAATKAGSYKTAWPKQSGLGIRSYMEEADAQQEYLIYTSERVGREPVPQEDSAVMDRAIALLERLPDRTPAGELSLVTGPVDIEWNGLMQPESFAAQALLTNRRLIIWWESLRGRGSGLIIFRHDEMIPRTEVAARLPYVWQSIESADFSMSLSSQTKTGHNAAVVLGVHFDNDQHANRRSMSVQATLNEIEERRKFGKSI